MKETIEILNAEAGNLVAELFPYCSFEIIKNGSKSFTKLSFTVLNPKDDITVENIINTYEEYIR